MDEDDTASERWLPVVGYEGSYEVSERGRVRSVDRVVPHQRYGAQPVRGRPLRTAQLEEGYLYVRLTRNNLASSRLVHRLVLDAFVGPAPSSDHEGCHWDRDPGNNYVSNLRWGTPKENREDMVRHGTSPSTRTHCPLDHILQEPNLRPGDLLNGHRKCLACSRGQGKVRYHARRGKTLDLKTETDQYYAQIMSEKQLLLS